MLKIKNNRVFFDEVDVVSFAKERVTPFFLFSETILRDNISLFKRSFSKSYKRMRIDYSAKTNNELGILRVIKDMGLGLEICTGHELYLAKKAGFASSTISFDGPVKKDEEIEFAIKEGIHAFYVDWEQEIYRLDRLAFNLKKKVKVVFRVNLQPRSIFLNLGEVFLKKFGMASDQILKTYLACSNLNNIKPIGLSTHLGTQLPDSEKHERAIEKLVQIAASLEKEGLGIEEINLGGGYPAPNITRTTLGSMVLLFLGVRYRKKVQSIASFGKKVSKKFFQETKKLKSNVLMAVQTGRGVVASSGIMVSQITSVKPGWIFLDVSTSCLPQSFLFAERKIINANKVGERESEKYNISGCSLNSVDIFSLKKPFACPEPGDICLVLDAGAYSISQASRFGSLPPQVLMISNGKIRQIRRREVYEDVSRPMEA